MTHGAFGPTRGYPAEYDPATYTGPTAEPGAALPGHDPRDSGAPARHGPQYAPLHAMPPVGVHVGFLNVNRVADPGTGVNLFTYTVPGGIDEEIIGCMFDFNASATVATRTCEVRFLDPNPSGSDSFATMQFAFPAQITASNSITLQAAQGCSFMYVPATPNNNATVTGIPRVILPSGWQFAVKALNAQAGDQFNGITITSMRYPNLPDNSEITRQRMHYG